MDVTKRWVILISNLMVDCCYREIPTNFENRLRKLFQICENIISTQRNLGTCFKLDILKSLDD